ncbi:MAG: hypothetical protein AAFR52_03605 [Pseudomonadota bacterium]
MTLTTRGLMGPLLPLWLAGVFAAVCGVIAIGTYVRPNAYRVLDWAINYADGFVRRGLFGEAMLAVEGATGLAILHQVAALQVALYAAFLAGVLMLVRRAASPAGAVLLLYSPALLLFPVASWHSAGRKEVLFLAAFAWLCAALARPGRDGRLPLTVFLAFSPLWVLAHEAMFLFMAWAFCLFLVLGGGVRDALRLAPVVVLPAAALAAAVLVPTDRATVVAVCAALEGRLGSPPLERLCASGDSAVIWLANDAATGIAVVEKELGAMLASLAPVLLLSGLAFLPLRPALAALTTGQRQRLALGAALAVAASLPLFVVAVDWGRWIHVHATCLALVALTLIARGPDRAEDWTEDRAKARVNTGAEDRGETPALPVWMVAVYALGWSLQYKGLLVGGGLPVALGLRLAGP